MLKKLFVAAAILMASPTFASAQDVFWSFSPTELITTSSEFSFNGNSVTGSAYIFSDGLFGFDVLDLILSSSDTDVIRFTGGEAYNPTFNTVGGLRFDFTEITVDAEGTSGGLLSLNITQNGVLPVVVELFDPGFVPGVGPNGAVLLARVDFELLGSGSADLGFALGPQGAMALPDNTLNPSFGAATISLTYAKLGYCTGDVNLSGIEENYYIDSVDFFDIAPFIVLLASGEYQFEADCNRDEVVDFLDIAPFIAILAGN